MKAKGQFISFLLIVDTALGGFTYGFNSRHCLVIDPSLPPVKPVQEKSEPVKEKIREKSQPLGKDAAKESKTEKASAKTSAKGHRAASGDGASKTKKHKAGKSAKEK